LTGWLCQFGRFNKGVVFEWYHSTSKPLEVVLRNRVGNQASFCMHSFSNDKKSSHYSNESHKSPHPPDIISCKEIVWIASYPPWHPSQSQKVLRKESQIYPNKYVIEMNLGSEWLNPQPSEQWIPHVKP